MNKQKCDSIFLVVDNVKKTVFVTALILSMLSAATWIASAEDITSHEIIELTSKEVLTVLKNDAAVIKNNPNKINADSKLR